MKGIRPFWCYYGGKWLFAEAYPPPAYSTIIEPFAGSAGYSLRYADLDVILSDASADVCETWRFLTKASRSEIEAIPIVDDVRSLPDSLSPGARLLVAWNMATGVASPRVTATAGVKRQRAKGRALCGWTPKRRAMIASQVERIRHWRVEGPRPYAECNNIRATWFVDPPYFGPAGAHYPEKVGDYAALGLWCRSRHGQVIVCEADGAAWLPFQPIGGKSKAFAGKKPVAEVLWTQDMTRATAGVIPGR